MKIYAGNLSYEVTEEDLQQEFSAFGEVTSVSVITDKYSGRPKGFGFVEMASKSEAEAAIGFKISCGSFDTNLCHQVVV